MIDLSGSGITTAQVRTQIDAALATLNDLSQAQSRTQADAALVAYDPVTGAEAAILNTKVDLINEIVAIIEHHFHNMEHWLGKSGNQSGNNWGADTLTPYRAISGNGVYGADANDEAKVLGSTDTPIESGETLFDIREIAVIALSSDTVYKLRIVWGTGTMAAAITALQYSQDMIITSTDKANKFGGAPFAIRMPKLAIGTKIWVQARNATNNATVDFFVGLHEY